MSLHSGQFVNPDNLGIQCTGSTEHLLHVLYIKVFNRLPDQMKFFFSTSRMVLAFREFLRYLSYADVLIWHLRGDAKARNFFKKIRQTEDTELWTGALQRAEIVFFMKPDEKKATLLFLSQFKTAAVDQFIVDAASVLYQKWHPSHGIDTHDAFLAATACIYGGKIYCMNIMHFPMPEVHVQKA